MQLAVFKFVEDEESIQDLTTIEIDGEPWFVASQVCSLLDIQNSRQAIQSLDEDEKLVYVLHTSGQKRSVNIINESGLYSLVFRSKKPSAKKFRKWITSEVIPTIRKTGRFNAPETKMLNFYIRYRDNLQQLDAGYFSVISELFVRLYSKFEMVGYIIPDKAFTGKEIRPDVSVGKMFASYIEKEYPFPEKYWKTYIHKFPTGVEVEARQYKNMLLPKFIEFIDDVWIPKCAAKYFRERDKKALDFLPKLLAK